MDCTSIEDQLRLLVDVIRENPYSCEFKWSLFYTAVISGNPSAIKPCPVDFLDKANNDLHLEQLQSTATQVPDLQNISVDSRDLPDVVIKLLFWLLVQRDPLPMVTVLPPQEYPDHLQKALNGKPRSQWPQYVFQILPNEDSHAEKRFRRHKEEIQGSVSDSGLFAFHGSKLESFHSILNFGLAQHLCKRDLYGDGTYLSTDMDVAMSFSGKGCGWPNTRLFGETLSCMALCEYVPNPLYIRNDPKKIPKSYVVLTNNEVVRVRYVLVFTRKKRPQEKSQSVVGAGAKTVLSVIFYLSILGMVGLWNRGGGWWK